MTEREPIETTNLDRYGSAELPWSRPRDLLAASASAKTSFFLGTVRPDGRPHAAAVGALWHDDKLYIVSGPQTRKSRNLAANSACTIAVGLEGIDYHRRWRYPGSRRARGGHQRRIYLRRMAGSLS